MTEDPRITGPESLNDEFARWLAVRYLKTLSGQPMLRRQNGYHLVERPCPECGIPVEGKNSRKLCAGCAARRVKMPAEGRAA